MVKHFTEIDHVTRIGQINSARPLYKLSHSSIYKTKLKLTVTQNVNDNYPWMPCLKTKFKKSKLYLIKIKFLMVTVKVTFFL